MTTCFHCGKLSERIIYCSDYQASINAARMTEIDDRCRESEKIASRNRRREPVEKPDVLPIFGTLQHGTRGGRRIIRSGKEMT